MNAKLIQYANGIYVEVKLKNRKVFVTRFLDGSYHFRFRRLDNSGGASLEENPKKGVYDVYLKLSGEAAVATANAVALIEEYVKEHNL